MRRFVLPIVLLVLMVVPAVTSASPKTSNASPDKVKAPQLEKVKDQELDKILGKDLALLKVKGSDEWVLEGVPSDPEVYTKLDEYFATKNSAKATGDVSIASTRTLSGSNSGWDDQAKSASSMTATRETTFSTEKITANGSQSASWNLVWPTPDSMSLMSTVCFDGVSVTISWPPSVTGTSDCGSYESDPWTGRTYVSHSYGPAVASSAIAVLGVSQSDSAIVRVGGHDYQPMSQVSLNFGI